MRMRHLSTILIAIVLGCGAAHAEDLSYSPLSSTSSGPAGSTSLSTLTSAVSSNTFDNAAFPQTWTWNSLSTQTALKLTASAETTGVVFQSQGTTLLGLGALTSSATSGFVYLPTSPGVPIGLPATQTGYVATEYDTTDNRLYIYNSGWSNVGTALSSLVGATTTNSFDNANFAQIWTWNTLSSGNALTLSTTNTGDVLALINTSTAGLAVSTTGNGLWQSNYTKQQSLVLSTTTFTPDFSQGDDILVSLTTGCVCGIANPTNIFPTGDKKGILFVVQPLTATTTVTWGSSYKFSGGSSPTLSTTTGAIDTFSYVEKDSTHIIVSSGALNAH